MTSASGSTAATPPASGPDDRWLRPALPVAACVLLVSALAHVRVPLLPDIGDDLSMSPSALGIAVTLFGLGRLALDLPAGNLADRFHPMRLMATSALVMGAGSALLAGAAHQAAVMTAFLLLGAASATANTTGMTSLTGAAPAHRRGSAMAMYSGCLLAGQALGPSLSGLVAGLTDWRVAAMSGAAMGLVVAAVGLSWRHGRPGSGRRGARRGATTGPPLSALERGVVYAVGFGVFLTVGAMPQTLVPLIGAAELDLGVSLIGAAIGVGGAARVVGALTAGAISDGVSRRAALVPCLVLQLLGVALLVADAGAAVWLAAVVLLSLGASAHAVAATVLADRVDPAHLGRSLGRYRFFADVGLVGGPLVAAVVYDHAGRVAAVGAITAILVVITVAAVALVPETRSRRSGSRSADGSD
ncbi:MFS transporter [Nocardioides caldifontis]|uniref:MFS transporter n=1 Tax=Nocardioides caldifontis TaxID=2588938 RepID=UPI0011DFA5C8|nr:MFS transporter [Nocardioides caldifontis]